jgi:hypothetical protein
MRFQETSIQWEHPCGGGVEYLHRDPASRRRRRKGKSRIWDIKIWSRVSRDSDPRKTALAWVSSIYKRQTRFLCQRGRPTKTRPYLSNTNKYLVMNPRWGSTPRLTDWLTVSRNVTLTLLIILYRNLWREELSTLSWIITTVRSRF